MENPLASIVVPVFNGEKYLDAALQSILDQDYRPIELIVVDDGSTDDTAGIAHSYEDVQYIYQENQGPSAARNAGIWVAHGEFISFLDADDRWTPDKLTVQIGYLQMHPDVDFVVAKRRMVIEEGVEKPSWYQDRVFEKDSSCFGAGALVARKTAFDKVGLYNTHYRFGENAEWLARAKDAGVNMAVLPQTLLISRVHENNQTHHQDEMRANILKALKHSIDRKRQKDSVK